MKVEVESSAPGSRPPPAEHDHHPVHQTGEGYALRSHDGGETDHTSAWSCEELSTSSKPSLPLFEPVATSSGSAGDIVRQGYLGKQRPNHRRYFVLRSGGHSGPSRVEWYKTKDKFAATDKSPRKSAALTSSKQRVLYMRCCIGVTRSNNSKKDHAVTLYTKDQTLLLVMSDQWEKVEWYLSIKKLFDEEQEDGFEEEDDGYCTLPPVAFYKEVWPVAIKPRDLGRSKFLSGEVRLCLTASALTLIQTGADCDWQSVKIPLLSVRRFGHLDGSFFLELGRSAPNGPGEIWMDAKDQGNQTMAQNIHEAVREAIKALRILPDFHSSPISNNTVRQTMSTKYCKSRCRENSVHVRPRSLPSRNPNNQSSPSRCSLEPCSPNASKVTSSSSEPDGYMDMEKEHKRGGFSSTATIGDDYTLANIVVETQDLGQEEGPTDVMSSKDDHNSGVPPRDDYVHMDSPQRHSLPALSTSISLSMMSFNSSESVTCLHSSHQCMEDGELLDCTKTPDKAAQELTPTREGRIFSFSHNFSSPDGSHHFSGRAAPSSTTTPYHSSPKHKVSFQDLTAVPEPTTGRRHCLSSCLRFCLSKQPG